MGINIGQVPTRLGIDPISYFYTSSAIWTKPTASNFYGIYVLCVAGAGGGGSGRRGLNTTNRIGGAGGGGGSRIIYFLPASQLSASHSVTVGAGGTGAPAITTNDTNGIRGNSGGTSSFGDGTGAFVKTLIPGSSGGGSGSQASSAGTGAGFGGTNTATAQLYIPFQSAGGYGGRATSLGSNTFEGAPAFGITNSNGFYFGAGGGAAGRITQTTTASVLYGAGGIYLLTGAVTGGAPGLPAGQNGANGVDFSGSALPDPFLGLGSNIPFVMGTGGGGGASSDLNGTIAAGNGGNGGRCAGGGGGGASTNGANSGAGGNGGDGFCAIVEIYGYASSSG